MKSLKLAFFALILCAFTLNSCKKSGNSTPKATNTVALKYNGTAYTTSIITAAYSKGALQIIGTFNTTTTIYLAIPLNFKVGSFDPAPGGGAATFTAGPAAEFFGDSGTITVTSFTSTTVAGTYSFTGTDVSNGSTCNITSGTFQTTFTTQ